MAKKLYVGSLSYNTTDASLRDHFAQAGTVETATVVMDKMTGRSRGFGFVEMASDAEADKAVEMLNGKELDGRALVVNEARPMAERPPRREGGFRGGRGGSFGSRGGGYGRREF
ncbi:RNA-binding protein [Candidatus Giovannonibacteria bacterium]|nr:RNA-binding protein [Candidatus Giovannonibacteria bacterium]